MTKSLARASTDCKVRRMAHTTTHKQCEDCGNFYNAAQGHTCVTYDGPVCETPGCEEPTVFVFIAAPGTGKGWSCKAGHYNGTRRELTIEDVI